MRQQKNYGLVNDILNCKQYITQKDSLIHMGMVNEILNCKQYTTLFYFPEKDTLVNDILNCKQYTTKKRLVNEIVNCKHEKYEKIKNLRKNKLNRILNDN